MDINALKQAIQALAKSLQVATVFPSALWVLANVFLVVLPLNPEWNLSSGASVTLIVSATLMLSYSLHAFNYPLQRLFEGYKFKYCRLFYPLQAYFEKKFVETQREIRELRKEQQTREKFPACKRTTQKAFPYCDLSEEELRARLRRAASNLEFDYPSEQAKVLPTSLGNVMAAFEDYSRTRYGMDSIVLWQRLVPILREKGYLEFVAQEKAVFDFLMNTLVILLFLGVELSYIYLWWGEVDRAIFFAFLTIVLCAILYWGMALAAQDWGGAVRVAFDLYRHDLFLHLGMVPGHDSSEDFDNWRAVSRFYLYRSTQAREFKGFRSHYQRTRG